MADQRTDSRKQKGVLNSSARIPKTNRFLCEELETLNRQLLYAPVPQREKQYLRAESLHDQVNDQQQYPFDFLVFRITGSRVNHQTNVLLVGEAVRHDLRLMIDAITRTLEIAGESAQYETVESLATQLNVSTKTISRWRKEGLRWRQVRLTQGKKKQICFTKDAVDSFVSRNKERVAKAAGFKRMDTMLQQSILSEAQLLRERYPTASFNRIATRVALKYRVAIETVRQYLSKQDDSSSGDVVFRQNEQVIGDREKQAIYRMYQRGIKTSKIADRYQRTSSTIYRIVNQAQYEELQKIDLQYIELPVFKRDDADEVILRHGIASIHEEIASSKIVAVEWDVIPEAIEPLLEKPKISDRMVRSLFVRFNYLKYKASSIREQLDDQNLSARQIHEIQSLLNESRVVFGLLIDCHTSHVVDNVRLHLLDQEDVPLWRVFSLLETANQCLSDTIKEYNPSRSTRFATTLKNYTMRRLIQVEEDQKKGKAVKRESLEQLAARYVGELNLLKNQY